MKAPRTATLRVLEFRDGEEGVIPSDSSYRAGGWRLAWRRVFSKVWIIRNSVKD